MLRNKYMIIFFCIFCLSYIGCDKDQKTQVEEKKETSSDGKVVELVGTGDGEKHLLQLNFRKNTEQDVELTMDNVIRISAGKRRAPSVHQKMYLGYVLKVTDVKKEQDDRVAYFQFKYNRVDMKQFPTNYRTRQLIKKLKQLEGETLIGSMDQKGKQGHIEMSEKARALFEDPMFRGMKLDVNKILKDIYPDIPKKPLGVGAKWNIKKQTTNNGVTMKVESTYLLEKAEKLPDNMVKCTIKIDGKMKLEHFLIRGGGTIQGRIVYIPACGRIISSKSTTKLQQIIPQGGKEMIMNMTMNMDFIEKSYKK